ncbi:unnamed protein product [Cuscuta epithymum]|uniref:Uncharacterized protein n=1 Tax=Cuscuta epithymum TaxID=186058 RepID=A0AAV0F0A5_9ASTE|nr:unnamed protein product [Cuscuta epithymum]
MKGHRSGPTLAGSTSRRHLNSRRLSVVFVNGLCLGKRIRKRQRKELTPDIVGVVAEGSCVLDGGGMDYLTHRPVPSSSPLLTGCLQQWRIEGKETEKRKAKRIEKQKRKSKIKIKSHVDIVHRETGKLQVLKLI